MSDQGRDAASGVLDLNGANAVRVAPPLLDALRAQPGKQFVVFDVAQIQASAAPPLATSASTSCVAGLIVSKQLALGLLLAQGHSVTLPISFRCF